MNYHIKTNLEDFFVRETIELKFNECGEFSYYLLQKTNLSTPEAVEIVSRKLKVSKKFINYAGIKDKKAVTEQAISIKNGPAKDFDFVKLKLKFLGKGKERLNLGDNSGNYFEIIVRNIKKKPKKIKNFVNYFDDQRFSGKNVEIGGAIVKKDFEKAADLIMKNDKKYGNVLNSYLGQNKNDFIGALRLFDKKILRIFIHSYQSYLWNLCISKKFEDKKYLKIKYSLGELNAPKEKIKNFSYPIAGFGTEKEDKILRGFLQKEKVSKMDFVIREIPELSSEGSERSVFAELKNLKFGNLEEDELNKGKKKIKISFELGKGSYATMAVKQMFSL